MCKTLKNMKHLKEATKKRWTNGIQWWLGSMIMLLISQITSNSLANGERIKEVPKKINKKIDTLPSILNKYHFLTK